MCSLPESNQLSETFFKPAIFLASCLKDSVPFVLANAMPSKQLVYNDVHAILFRIKPANLLSAWIIILFAQTSDLVLFKIQNKRDSQIHVIRDDAVNNIGLHNSYSLA